MGRSKEKTLYWIWKKYSESRWKEKLKEVGVVSEEDVNGFLKLVGEREIQWVPWKLGYFVSLVLRCCYGGWIIELDIKAIDGKIDVGYKLNWGGILYVKGDVKGSVGSWMKGGIIVVNGDVGREVGICMEGGVIVVNGDVGGDVGYGMSGGLIIIKGDVRRYMGYGMIGGMIVVDRHIKHNEWLEELGKGFVVYKGFVYTGRWVE